MDVSTQSPSPNNIKIENRLIVALDFAEAVEAWALVQVLGSDVNFYKIGLQLFSSGGPEFVRKLIGAKKDVFLDLKFHDIPNTVSQAVRSAAALGVKMLTVHASGGSQMLDAAVQAASASGCKDLTVLAVTVLTSLSDVDLKNVGIIDSAEKQVLRLARLAQDTGCGGLVLSPQELGPVRALVGPDMVIVTPGVRPSGSQKNDQNRVATPSDALKNGASYLVVGRPITASPEPHAAAKKIMQEMAAATQT